MKFTGSTYLYLYPYRTRQSCRSCWHGEQIPSLGIPTTYDFENSNCYCRLYLSIWYSYFAFYDHRHRLLLEAFIALGNIIIMQ